jgi:phosphoserine phosphatase
VKIASIVLDVDSTLCGVEGIDWLAQRRGADVAQRTRGLTDRAMNGEIALDSVYGERLALIRPTRSDVDELGHVYRRTIAEGAADSIRAWTKRGLRVALVSGGIREAIAPLARELGVPVYAVSLRFDDKGDYVDFDRASPLATQQGKLEVLRSLALPRPILAVGDGATDIAMKQAADRFVAYTGFARREQVVGAADGEVSSFDQLAQVLNAVFPAR